MRKEVGQSPDEIFDLVDEHDQVIGLLARSEIHRQQRRHRAIHIFWIRADGLICLQRRAYSKDNCPGLLSTACAGHVDSGEGYAAAAQRELFEELGIQVSLAQLPEIDYAPAHPDLGHEFVRSYLLRGDFKPVIARPEVDSLLWRHPEELWAWIAAQPAIFATPLIHLLARPVVRLNLGLA